MSKRKRYSPEYKHELVELVRRSKSSCRQIALEVGVNPALLTRWVREADAGGSKAFPGGGTPRDEELARLKRELGRVTKERDFLRDAATFFAELRTRSLRHGTRGNDDRMPQSGLSRRPGSSRMSLLWMFEKLDASRLTEKTVCFYLETISM